MASYGGLDKYDPFMYIPYLFKSDKLYWAALALAIICLLSTLFWIFACFIHRCVMNYVLIVFALMWFAFNIVLLVGLLIKNQVMLRIWLHANVYITLVMLVLIIVYASHCCCCCLEPNGCGIALLILGAIFYVVVADLTELIVACVLWQMMMKK